jgi:sugar O-acyltransferase (sialic acid O-acetyltransferase NeuD family)
MRKKLVLFGLGEIAQVADFYFTHDSDYDVAALTVDRAFAEESEKFGRPVVAFEDVAQKYPPGEHEFFAAVGYSQLNRLRREKLEAAKSMGYRIASYLSSKATVWPGFELKENCFILEDNTIQPFARVGFNTTLWSGNHIGHHAAIGDHCFLASHIVVSGGVEIGEHCFVGVNAVIRDHVKVGARCVIGAGSVIVSDAEPDGVYAPPATERSKVPSSRLRRI